MQNKFEVGQQVHLSENGRDAGMVEVTRIGRTNVYIEQYGRERAFDRESGFQKGSYVGYGSYITTPARRVWEIERATLFKRIQELGFEGVRYSQPDYTNTTLRLVIKALEGDADA